MAAPTTRHGRTQVNLDELRREVADGAIDTVLLVMTDMQGRLMGKRLHAPFFVAEIAEHGAEGCYYLLGDNRAESVDSRAFGAVDRRLFIGKVVFSLGGGT